MGRPLISVLALAITAGCAWMNYFNPADVRQGIWKHIRASGIAKDATHTPLIDKMRVEGKTSYFTAEDEKVTYWAHFSGFAFHSPYHVNFQARWYDPDGNLFFEEVFPLNNMFDAMFIKAHLPIKDSPAQHFPGLWQVEIYYQGYPIDKKQFHILPGDPGTYHAVPQAPPTSESVSQLWEVVNARRTGSEDRVFLEKFDQGRQLIQERKLGEAKLLFDGILREEPYRTEAHLGLAAVYYALEKWGEALAELDYVVQNPHYRERAMAVREHILEMAQKKL